MVASQNQRGTLAANYFSAILKIADEMWEATFQQYESAPTGACCPVRMALLNPRFYESLGFSGVCRIRGSRQFSSVEKSIQGKCQSITLWGYDCPTSEGTLEADHIFPFAFGGVTVATNKAYLCSSHNRCKGADFHAFPWELSEPAWVQSTLLNIASFRKSVKNKK
jgi:hypothetical protein